MTPIEELIVRLTKIHSVLDEALGDSEPMHIEDDEELRRDYPIEWVAQQISQVVASLASLPENDGGGK
jgi:hypothetical protein